MNEQVGDELLIAFKAMSGYDVVKANNEYDKDFDIAFQHTKMRNDNARRVGRPSGV